MSISNHKLFLNPCANHGLCEDANCKHAVVFDTMSKKWFITMGHAGFNSEQNNRGGFDSEELARKIVARYLGQL